MIPGSLRYSRQLGFVGATAAEKERGFLERALGLDLTGSAKPSGGSGYTIGAAPSTILMGLIGAASWSSFKGGISVKNSMIGFVAGAGLATAMRFSSEIGF